MYPKKLIILAESTSKAPPRVKSPEPVTEPLKDIPLTVPVPPTDLTVPEESVLLLKVFQSPLVK